MRIRKRKVPLPLSQLSPIPLSDPHLFSRLPVVQLDQSNHFTTVSPRSSDHLITHTCGSVTDLDVHNHNNSSSTTTAATTNNNNVSLLVTLGDEGVHMSNDVSSNASITTTCAPSDDNNNDNNNNNNININNGLLPPRLLSNNEGVGRWCNGDRVVPLKKRRTMVVKYGNVVENEEEKQVMKGGVVVASSDVTRVVNGTGDNTQVVVTGGKKGGGSKRGNTIMEGSRCSRVNGRGWRCCQQTLVGYSLCEHHLGKGRLRSMTSSTTAKSRSKKKMGAANNNNATYPANTTGGFALGSHDKAKEKLVGEGDEKKMERMSSFGSNSKRAKLGVVKARSLSSLLGQPITMNNNIIVGDQQHHANMPQQEKISN